MRDSTSWLAYKRPGQAGISRIYLTRTRRRILLALLSDAGNLHGWRIHQVAQVGIVCLYPFLDHLESAGWIQREQRTIGDQQCICYSLTSNGRRGAHNVLGLVSPEQLVPDTDDAAPQNVRIVVNGRVYPCDMQRDPDQDKDGCVAWVAAPRERLPPFSAPAYLRADVIPAKTILSVRTEAESTDNKENDHEY